MSTLITEPMLLERVRAAAELLEMRTNRRVVPDLPGPLRPDTLADAYENTNGQFAPGSGTKAGEFYTPRQVVKLIVECLDPQPGMSVYDPTCGSGSLLLKVADEAPQGLTLYGQEKDNGTWALAKMNMILHGNETAEIHLKGRKEVLPVSRNYLHVFRP